jgi:hypothetical protein
MYIKFTKDPKQTKILIFQKYWCRPLFWKNKNRLVYLKNKSWLVHAIFFVFFMQFFCFFCFFLFFFVKALLMFCIILTSQTNTCYTCIIHFNTCTSILLNVLFRGILIISSEREIWEELHFLINDVVSIFELLYSIL